MIYTEPEMEVIEFNNIETVVEASVPIENIGGTTTEPTEPDVDLF